ncbi:hypothetical protein [Streptomyces sp. NPDC087294]|uniref:hypothetical protein n=1 Tax=Streptomyces sp. NPDC087294 TaxID=3365777 RepID=UPI0038284DD6
MLVHHAGDLARPLFGVHERALSVLLDQFGQVLAGARDDHAFPVELRVTGMDG